MGDPDRPGTFEEAPEHVCGCGGVFEGSMGRSHRRAEVASKRAEPEVAGLPTEEAARQCQRVDRAIGKSPIPVGDRGGVEIAEVVANVVADDDRIADEFEECGDRLGHPRSAHEHAVGDPRHDRDERRNRQTRIHQCLKRPPGFTADVSDRPDLGDAEVGGDATGGLDVEDAERHLRQVRSHVLKRSLIGGAAPASTEGDLMLPEQVFAPK